MPDKKIKFETVTPPKGTAVGYVYLTDPDKGREDWGDYTPQYKMDVAYEQAPAALIAAIDKEYARVQKEAEKKAASKKPPKQAVGNPKPYWEDPEDGSTVIRTGAVSQYKDKDGKVHKLEPKLIDHKLTPVDRNKIGKIASGSIVRPQVQVAGWVNPKCEYGVKLRLNAVQVIKPVFFVAGVDPSAFEEEDGEDIDEQDDGFGDFEDETDDDDSEEF